MTTMARLEEVSAIITVNSCS